MSNEETKELMSNVVLSFTQNRYGEWVETIENEGDFDVIEIDVIKKYIHKNFHDLLDIYYNSEEYKFVKDCYKEESES